MADKVDAVIKVKRGPEAQRKTVTFKDGELAYSNDIKRLFVGDGGYGGNAAGAKVHTTSSTLLSTLSALSGDLVIDVLGDTRILYALTGSDFENLSAYALLTRSDVDACVQSNSALWTAGGLGGNAGPGTEAWTVVSVNSAKWGSVYTHVNDVSANWGVGGGGTSEELYYTYTTVRDNSASWNEFSSAVLSTFETPLTASGKFLVVNIEGIPQAIRLWDTP